MRISVDDPSLLPDLAERLSRDVAFVVAREGNALAVSLLGSIRQELLHFELEQRLRPWRMRHPRVQVVVDPRG
jgi:hypothetical protein